jgi:hypothetical protein
VIQQQAIPIISYLEGREGRGLRGHGGRVEGEVVEGAADRSPAVVLLRLRRDQVGGMLPVEPLRRDGAGGGRREEVRGRVEQDGRVQQLGGAEPGRDGEVGGGRHRRRRDGQAGRLRRLELGHAYAAAPGGAAVEQPPRRPLLMIGARGSYHVRCCPREQLREGGDEGRRREREPAVLQAPRRGRHGERRRAEQPGGGRDPGGEIRSEVGGACVTDRGVADGSGCSVAGVPFIADGSRAVNCQPRLVWGRLLSNGFTYWWGRSQVGPKSQWGSEAELNVNVLETGCFSEGRSLTQRCVYVKARAV